MQQLHFHMGSSSMYFGLEERCRKVYDGLPNLTGVTWRPLEIWGGGVVGGDGGVGGGQKVERTF